MILKDHERFNKIAAGIQSIIVSVAVLAGGGWTLYTFVSLSLLEKAKVDLEKTRAEVTDFFHKQAVLEMNMSTTQVPQSASGDYYLAVAVTVQNKGARDTHIQWTRATPLTIRRLTRPDGHPIDRDELIFEKPVRPVGEHSDDKYLILAGGTLHLPFLVHVKGPGLYYLEFQTEVSTVDLKSEGVKRVSDGRPLVWTDTALAIITDRSNKE